jgi:hypothetical protein
MYQGRENPEQVMSEEEGSMQQDWEKQLACAGYCGRCQKSLTQKDQRFLSVYDHQPICTACKQEEEKRPDYEDISKQMISACLQATNKPYGDPASYCFHHFCPFNCKEQSS